MKPLFHSITCLAMALFGLSAAVPVGAQTGKEGTVIRFDKSTAHGLFSNVASNSSINSQPFALLRHDISPVQLFVSNEGYVRPDGIFSDIANSFFFDTSSNQFSITSNSTYDNGTPYFAVIAPKGFRFTKFEWDIDEADSQNNMTLQRVTYDGEGEATLVGNVFTVNGSNASKVWSVPMENGSNTIYFKITSPSSSSKLCVNSLKLWYAIDQPYEGQIPTVNKKTEVSTGVLDLGLFSSNKDTNPNANGGKGYWGFKKTNFTDVQTVSIHKDGSDITTEATSGVVSVNGENYYVAASDGDYYVEAPKKFRVVEATLNFLRSESVDNVTLTKNTITSLPTGEYALTSHYSYNGNNFLNLSSSGKVVNCLDATQATKWTITKTTSGATTYYTIESNGKYLAYSDGGLSVSSSPFNWRYDSYTNTNGYVQWAFYYQPNNSTTQYKLKFNTSKLAWEATTGNGWYGAVAATVSVGNAPFNAGDFTATVYDRDGEKILQEKLLTAEDGSVSVPMQDFNNDAVRFRISGLEGKSALYNVNLRLLPLNPELQNLSVGSKFGDSEGFENTTSFGCENYDFNNGEAVSVVVPEAVATENSECTVEFLNADNEEKTKWYTDGSLENNTASTGGYSNFFLVGSKADKGTGDNVELDFALGAGSQPDARTSATKAGANALDFTNIKNLWNGPDEYLVQNEFKKTEANYGEAKLSVDGAEKQFYIYSADQPTFQILDGSKHIDFRYYTLKVKCVKQVEKPEVTIVPIYTATLKSASRDGKIPSDANTLDTKHTFYGVKVKAVRANNNTNEEIYGYLTSKSVMDAVKEQLKGKNYYGFEEANALRGMLYLDISDLRRTDDTEFGADFRANVADNFLFFVPDGMSTPTDVTNVVSKTGEGAFVAGRNIVVRDQQPFFTPYDFRTSNHYVTYEREGTATAAGGDNKAKVKNMAVVLPFDVPLDGYGHMMADTSVVYCNVTAADSLTSIRKGDGAELTWGVLADSVVGVQTAEANVPYYVANKAKEGLGFTYNIQNAQFRKTGTLSADGTKVDSFEPLSSKKGTWTTTGSYCGEQVTKSYLRWYFSKDFFWKSGVLNSSNHFNVRPFRAWFEAEINYPTQSQFAVVFDRSEFVTDGIGSAAAEAASLQVASGRGFISVVAGVSAKVAVRTLAGQLVYAGNLSAGEARRFSVAKGVYLVNNVKVVVR